MTRGLWRGGHTTGSRSGRIVALAAALGLAAAVASCSSGSEPGQEAGAVTVAAVDDSVPTTTSSTAPSASALAVTVQPAPAAGDDPASAAPSVSTDPTGSSSTGSTAVTATTGTTSSDTAPASTAATAPQPPPGSSRVVGTGTPASCTSDAVVAAVAAGGHISFDCGPSPVTITLAATAKVVNANGPDIVIDGGGLVTLSGGGRHRILYQNTCDQAQGWTTSHCNDQDHPRLTVRNITLANGDATGERTDGGGGGAIFVRGGRLRIENVTFVDNRCDPSDPDLGGAAVRALSQSQGRPVEVIGSTFRGGVCANGGAISSIGVSWVITDSVMTGNRAIGNGASSAGGGNGGAIYADGNDFTVEVRRTRIEDNHANEGGGAIFFVSNNGTGRLSINDSTLRTNPSDGFETAGYPGIFFLGAGSPTTSGSTLQ
jgi:hypothetical protein